MMKIPAPLMEELKACRTLPSIPTVALQVLNLCQDEDLSIDKVAKAIMRDPALASKVLKVANSAWYGVRAQVTTLERAITLLGVTATLSLTLSFSLVRGLRKYKTGKFDYQAYWQRSAISATATRSAGLFVKASRSDELFLIGLLQDIGMLILNEIIPKIYGPLVASSNNSHDSLIAAERAELGVDHALVGSWLLSKWNFPEVLQKAIAGSHEPEKSGQFRPLTKTVALGSRIAEIWINPDTFAATAAAGEAAHSFFNISPKDFDTILGKVAGALPEVIENLDINIGGETYANRLLDQARDALAELSLKTQQQAKQIQIQAQHDQLTSVYNRAYLNEFFPLLFEKSKQSGQPMTIIFLDIDYFKSINDTHGHDEGDSVLAAVAQEIVSATRALDTVVRYGGDEFIILLEKCDEEVGAMIAERIRSTVEAQTLKLNSGEQVKVTLSVGCATMASKTPFESGKELLDAADSCLYKAKSQGRNRVVTFAAMDSIKTA
jgi:two-component system, cell cycle response regulator